MSGIEQGSIIVDADLAKVAEIRSVLEDRWGEKVQIAEVLTDLLVMDEIAFQVREFNGELEGMTASDFFKYVWHNVENERREAEKAEMLSFFKFVREPNEGHYADEEKEAKSK